MFPMDISGNDKIIVFDTTLRDGEQAPGYSMTLEEKLLVASQLEALGVDVIEAGFAVASHGDYESVRQISCAVKECKVASLARALQKDIDAAAEAVSKAAHPVIHTFLATSDIHLENKLKMSREDALEQIARMVKYARGCCAEVEFSLEDATRTEYGYLCKVVETAINCGAAVVNLPDTVGYATPGEMSKIVKGLLNDVPNAGNAVLSMHAHNDLGLAVANSLAGIMAGARQVECTIGGIGERAGNAALEEVVMGLATRKDYYGNFTHSVKTKQIGKTARLVSAITGIKIPPNKAIIGQNAFAHESGIHQHGIMANASTYEIMSPESVGAQKPDFVLGKHSGAHAFNERLNALGYTHLTRGRRMELFNAFKKFADRKKNVTDRDISALVDASMIQPDNRQDRYTLESFVINSGNRMSATACVTLKRGKETYEEVAVGTGPIYASVKAVEMIIRHPFSLDDFQIHSVTEHRDALGEVSVKISDESGSYRGRGVSTDIIEGSILATLAAVNRMLGGSEKALGTGAASCAQHSFDI